MTTTQKTRSRRQKINKAQADVKQEPVIKTSAHIPKTLHKRMKQRALDEETTTKAIIIKALEHYLNKK